MHIIAQDIPNQNAHTLLHFDESYQCIDMHCHVDFAFRPQMLAQEAQQRKIGLFSGTISPNGYKRAAKLLGSFKNVRVGLGLHPWWITEQTFNDGVLEEFLTLLPTTQYINEVGLDFSSRFSDHKEMQVRALKCILRALSQASELPYLISLHSTKAADVVLDLLEETNSLKNATCIFHWFNGSSNELNRAIKNGCFFSVGERFLATKRGKEYLKAIPWSRLLLETDLPSAPVDSSSGDSAIFSSLQSAQRLVEELKQN